LVGPASPYTRLAASSGSITPSTLCRIVRTNALPCSPVEVEGGEGKHSSAALSLPNATDAIEVAGGGIASTVPFCTYATIIGANYRHSRLLHLRAFPLISAIFVLLHSIIQRTKVPLAGATRPRSTARASEIRDCHLVVVVAAVVAATIGYVYGPRPLNPLL